jgi:hypothetical protein
MKIVINNCYGGFRLSEEAIDRYIEIAGLKLHKHWDDKWKWTSYYLVPYEEYQRVHKNDMTKTEWEGKDKGYGRYMDSNALCWNEGDIERNDPILIRVIEELHKSAGSKYSDLKIVDIPDGVEWIIEEYDGKEWIAEKHRTWS